MANRLLPERVALARDRCAQWVKEGHTTALSVCVLHRGEIALQQAFGALGPESDASPLALDSLWPLSSLTKTITATLVMQCVEDGLLSLNRPVREYLPEITAKDTDQILVHHLLTHSSGFVFYDEEPLASHVQQKLDSGTFTPPECPDTQHPIVNAVLHLFYDCPLAIPPGQQMIYSDLNYQFLGEIVRRLRGRRFWELAYERVLGPLGMQDSHFIVPESDAGRVVQRPLEAPLAAPESPFNQGIGSRQMQETPYSSGGLFSTPRDMATFGQAILQGGRAGDVRILSPASVAAMTRDQIPGLCARFLAREGAIASWGYGFAVESASKWPFYHGSLQSLGTISHGGGGGAKLWIDRDREIVGVYFEACLRGDEETGEQYWNVDLFENLITSAWDGA